MTLFSPTHICFLTATVAFLVLSCYAVSRMSRTGQNIMFVLAALLCAGGIFYRYGMGLSTDGELTLGTLATQMLQVCNFNFVLVILMLIPRCEIARQYSVMFSMFAAMTTFISIPGDWTNRMWYEPTVLNSWLNHLFAIALPMWMVAARRLKPRREYISRVLGCVLVYFTVAYIATAALRVTGVIAPDKSFSFIFDTGNVPILNFLWSVIPYSYFYLLPLMPLLYIFFRLLAIAFRRYETCYYHL